VVSVLTVVQDFKSISSSGKTKDDPGEAMSLFSDITGGNAISKRLIQDAELFHQVVEKTALEQLGCNQAYKQGMETYARKPGQLEGGEEDHCNEK
jgi:hypothetical protein